MVTYLEWFSSNRIPPLYPLFPGCRLLNGRSQTEELRTPPGKSRKINISRQQPLAVLTAGGGGESIKVSSPNSAASSHGRSPSHPLLTAGQRHGRPGGGGYLQSPPGGVYPVSVVVVCRVPAIREYFLLQWILAREQRGAQPAAHCCQAR